MKVIYNKHYEGTIVPCNNSNRARIKTAFFENEVSTGHLMANSYTIEKGKKYSVDFTLAGEPQRGVRL